MVKRNFFQPNHKLNVLRTCSIFPPMVALALEHFIKFCAAATGGGMEHIMSDCIFCKIVSGDIPSKKFYEDDKVLVFHDISPQTPIHLLIIPKEHIQSVSEITSENSNLIAYIFEVIARLTKGSEFKNGFRIISNCGEYAGQTVPHLHFHILGGKMLELQMG